jgi:alanine-glyoxylate transaminase/serine-glyoxylate transaminase/serine-pyruvate transaminase
LLDDVRISLGRLFRADEQALTIATSGTGTSAMEAAVANTVSDGMTALVVVNGYFGDRLAQIIERYGATSAVVDVEWGRACDPATVREELRREQTDVLAFVHAETSTGVLNPRRTWPRVAREHGALTIMDAVTSLGGHELELAEWGIDVAYSCSQKCIGAPLGHVADRGLGSRPGTDGQVPQLLSGSEAAGRLLDQPQVPSHAVDDAHLRAARSAADGGRGRPGRAAGPAPQAPRGPACRCRGHGIVPGAAGGRASLDAEHRARPSRRGRGGRAAHAAVDVQSGVGAGLGPLAGKIWRVGLMGASSTPQSLLQFLAAFETALAINGYQAPGGAGVAAAQAALRA